MIVLRSTEIEEATQLCALDAMLSDVTSLITRNAETSSAHGERRGEECAFAGCARVAIVWMSGLVFVLSTIVLSSLLFVSTVASFSLPCRGRLPAPADLAAHSQRP